MPIIDIYAAPRAEYDNCLYNNDVHNAVEACTCAYARRPCEEPKDESTKQCIACQACPNCTDFYRTKAARGAHRSLTREEGQPWFPLGFR